MGNITQYNNQDTTRLPSGTIWSDCPWDDIRQGLANGVLFFDDFAEFQPLTFATGALQTTAGGLGGKYTAYCATAGTWAPDSMPHGTTATPGGIISGLCDTDGDSMAIGTLSCPFSLLTTLTGKLWFESRIATTSILTNMGQIFNGLHENNVTAFSATCPLGNADTGCATTAGIGFRRSEDGLNALDTVYWDHSATQVVVQAAASSVLAANTFVKLGLKVDFNETTKFLTFFVNGAPCSTQVSKATILATTSLDAVNLGACLAFYADSAGTSDYLYADWWKGCQTF